MKPTMLKTGRLDALTVVLQCSGLFDVGQDWNFVGQLCITVSDERIKQWQNAIYKKTRRKEGEKGPLTIIIRVCAQHTKFMAEHFRLQL